MPVSEATINDLRKRVLNNEPYTQEELAEHVKTMIADRVNSFEAPKSKAKSKSTPVNLDDLI